jgi:hypothetical protein
MSNTYLTAEELSARIKYDARTKLGQCKVKSWQPVHLSDWFTREPR